MDTDGTNNAAVLEASDQSYINEMEILDEPIGGML